MDLAENVLYHETFFHKALNFVLALYREKILQ